MSDKLALSPEEFRSIAAAAVDFLTGYYQTVEDRPVLVPTTSREIRAAIDEPLPQAGADFAALLDTLRDVICHYSRHSAHPRMFGYVASPGTGITTLGGMLAAALNINVTSWRSAPSGTGLEHLTIDWLKEMLGYPATASGLLTSGGSMATFAALGAARSAKAGVDVVRNGVGAIGRTMCAYVSEEGHFSVAKAAGMLGLGEGSVRMVKTDDCFHIDMADLARLVSTTLPRILAQRQHGPGRACADAVELFLFLSGHGFGQPCNPLGK